MEIDGDRVLDSSVVLAALKAERSELHLPSLIEGASMSSVNLSEVFSKVRELGFDRSPQLRTILALLKRVEPFTAVQARLAADLRDETRKRGLSLGDRACLALAINLGVPVYTADTRWAEAEVPCTVHLIRYPQDLSSELTL